MKQIDRSPPASRFAVWYGAYRDGVAIQTDLQTQRQAEQIPDTLLLLGAPSGLSRAVGARSTASCRSARTSTAREGIEIVPTDRGGRVTYHGPGQLVGYPIMRVNDIGAHLRTMEAAIVAALAEYGIEARSRCAEGIDYTGVWVTRPQDRLDRRPRLARRLHARLCRQRRQRSGAVLVDRRVRAARCDDDLGRARARTRAGGRLR